MHFDFVSAIIFFVALLLTLYCFSASFRFSFAVASTFSVHHQVSLLFGVRGFSYHVHCCLCGGSKRISGDTTDEVKKLKLDADWLKRHLLHVYTSQPEVIAVIQR